jgi:hypothetical protein
VGSREIVDLHVAGAKDDAAKLPVELVPPEAIEAIAEILDFGRQKYTEDGWKEVPNAYRRYTAAALRHIYAILRGELIDEDSGKPHVYHLACNAAFLCYLHKRGIACRPFPATSGADVPMPFPSAINPVRDCDDCNKR